MKRDSTWLTCLTVISKIEVAVLLKGGKELFTVAAPSFGADVLQAQEESA